MSDDKRVYIFDSTLRDGAQTNGVDFTVADKLAIAKELDNLGIDYIEGGWPGANPTDDSFYENVPPMTRARLGTFGMTRRAGRSVDNDPGFQALFSTSATATTIVGKSWDFHATVALGVDLDENLAMIEESVTHACSRVEEVIFDAEHFFDGYKANKEFAMSCIETAYKAGARWVTLCDTNGGTLPDEIETIINDVTRIVPGKNLSIHCHNDTENAVANSLAAVRAGVRQVQGTLNGLGERCGNANLTAIIPSLMLKMGFETGLSMDDLASLTHVSRFIDERLNRAPARNAAYVGDAAFAHKGGLHVSAVEKDPKSYEHIEPQLVGNQRHILVSDQAGRSNVLAQLRDMGIEVANDDPKVGKLLKEVKELEFQGLSFDGAEASFELLARRTLSDVPDYFKLHSFRVIDERRYNAKGDLVTVSEASVRVYVDDEYYLEAAEGNGPVDAIAGALRKILVPKYPSLAQMQLVDYKVRILAPERGTGAITRVMIESMDDKGARWTTVGVSEDIIDASYNALHDAFIYCLVKD